MQIGSPRILRACADSKLLLWRRDVWPSRQKLLVQQNLNSKVNKFKNNMGTWQLYEGLYWCVFDVCLALPRLPSCQELSNTFICQQVSCALDPLAFVPPSLSPPLYIPTHQTRINHTHTYTVYMPSLLSQFSLYVCTSPRLECLPTLRLLLSNPRYALELAWPYALEWSPFL